MTISFAETNMATKGRKSGEKKSGKKTEEPPILDEKAGEDQPPDVLDELKPEEVAQEPEPVKEPSPEPVYDEPTLTELIVENYEGDLVQGMYEGEGTAYFTGGHTYKGSFVEGIMQGTGQYTWADGVTYQGEFTNNHVTGKGTYRWPDGSYYEGDVLNGMRHGVGQYVLKNNKMSYSGEWCQGRRHGRGCMTYDSEGKSTYEGDWVNNIRHGYGVRVYPSGNKYDGMWFNNVRHGQGKMMWGNEQLYDGQWQDGIQHGLGRHIWFLRRATGSQYPLRNMYEGNFVKGLRQGQGVFHYANGAKYEGNWLDNMKSGSGKFTFKNGRIYEGIFEKDHIAEFPSFTIEGNVTPDLDQIRTRTPLPSDGQSVHSNESRNTLSPTLQLDISHLLTDFTEIDREEEVQQVLFVIMRHMTNLKRVYNYYSSLGVNTEESRDNADNTYVMTRMQFWRLMKDCHFHHHCTTLSALDRALGIRRPTDTIHNPFEDILFREFLNHMVSIAYTIYHEDHEGTGPVLAWCLSVLMADNVLPNACHVQGHFYYDANRASHASNHVDRAYEVYQCHSKMRKYSPNDKVIKMREFLYMMKDYKLINDDLTTRAIIEILATDDPAVLDKEEGHEALNLELEMTFLEFFEALIGCAQVFVTDAVVKDPTTPRPSTTMTHEQSMGSLPLSPGRMGSQAGLDEDEMTEKSSVHNGGGSVAEGLSPRAPSSADVQHHGSSKPDKEGYHSVTPHVVDSLSHPASQASFRNIIQSEASQANMDPKKSTSFISTHSVGGADGEPPKSESVASGEELHEEQPQEHDAPHIEGEDDVEELDEETKAFNYWTHQIHIFFVRKFLAAADRAAMLDARALERLNMEDNVCPIHGPIAVED